jgi:selenide,water dikinase
MYGRLSWLLKDRIDRNFMAKFSDLPTMEETPDDPMHCGGCAAKISSSVLQEALSESGESTGSLDDAALIELSGDQVSIQSTDYMPAIVQDPYLFGRIATQHAMSDVFAMGGQVRSGLLTVILPHHGPKIVGRDLSDLIAGAKEELVRAGGSLIGGHSASGYETAMSMTVNGLGVRSRLWPKGGAQQRDALILTKPLGVGMLFAGFMRQKVGGVAIDGTLESMLLSNRIVVECLQGENSGVHGASDVTGFGLLGHLVEMLDSSGHQMHLNMDAIPLLKGVEDVLGEKIESSLAPNNRSFGARIEGGVSHKFEPILYDPQTSGGLLLSVDPAKADSMVQTLRSAGLVHAAIIGSVGAKATTPMVGVR